MPMKSSQLIFPSGFLAASDCANATFELATKAAATTPIAIRGKYIRISFRCFIRLDLTLVPLIHECAHFVHSMKAENFASLGPSSEERQERLLDFGPIAGGRRYRIPKEKSCAKTGDEGRVSRGRKFSRHSVPDT